MNDGASGAQKVCPSCGAENGPEAKFCANCGARLVPQNDLNLAFEATVADVIQPDEVPEHSSEGDSDLAPIDASPDADTAESSAYPVEVVDPPVSVERSAEENGWPAVPAESSKKTNKTAIWVAVGIVAFILFCCCVFGIVATVSAERDSSLQQELTYIRAG